MLISGTKLIDMPVMSLQTGSPIGWVKKAYLNADDLKIAVLELHGPLIGKSTERYIDTKSIREYSEYGFIVDSAEELFDVVDVQKLRRIVDLDYDIIGLKVVSLGKSRLGRIEDFTVTSDDLMLQQLIVKRPSWKAIIDSELVIPRKEIVEVDEKRIVVKDDEKTIRAKAEEEFVPNYVNPFRKKPAESEFAPARSQNPDEEDN
jgi:uncharacterized protein YrrD